MKDMLKNPLLLTVVGAVVAMLVYNYAIVPMLDSRAVGNAADEDAFESSDRLRVN